MRRRLRSSRTWAVISSLALASIAAPASADVSSDGLLNWTQSWLTFDGEAWTLSGFEFASEDYDLADIDLTTPVLDDPTIIQNDIFGADESFAGTVLQVLIPNFFDPLPRKLVHVEFLGDNPSPSVLDRPGVLDIIGFDSPFSEPGPGTTIVCPDRTGDENECRLVDLGGEAFDGGFRVFETWEMFPNPDTEVVKMFVPVGFEATSIHITTQSLPLVPEPATLALLGTGLLGLLLTGRRRH